MQYTIIITVQYVYTNVVSERASSHPSYIVGVLLKLQEKRLGIIYRAVLDEVLDGVLLSAHRIVHVGTVTASHANKRYTQPLTVTAVNGYSRQRLQRSTVTNINGYDGQRLQPSKSKLRYKVEGHRQHPHTNC